MIVPFVRVCRKTGDRNCMKINNSKIYNNIEEYFLFFAALSIFFVFILLIFRDHGIYPFIFSDEYTYSKFSRLLPFADATIPCYLYLIIYRITSFCGNGFLECARMLNSLSFVAAAPLIYLIARRVCTRTIASIVTLLVLLGPINSYTVLFMPESLYFFSFWLLSWFILRLDNSSDFRSWSVAGLLLGLTSLVKPHALFLLPAIVAYIFFISIQKEGIWVLQALKKTVIFIAVAFTAKLFIGYLCAGNSGITLFGSSYSSNPGFSTLSFQRFIGLLAFAAESIKGHTTAMCLMFGVPIAIAINTAINFATAKVEIKADQKIYFYASVLLGSLILVTGLYTASVVNLGPYETVGRLHMRYYNFVLPLLLLVAASQLSLEPINGKRYWRVITALPIGAAILYAAYTRMAPFAPSIIDCPELRGFTSSYKVFYVLSGLSFLALAVWVYAVKAGAKIYIYVFLPLTVIFSSFFINQELRSHLVPDVYDKAGMITRQYLENDDLSKVLVVGSGLGELFRTLFYLDNPKASLEAVPLGAAYHLENIPRDKKWVLVIGDYPLTRKALFQISMNGFTLVCAKSTNTIDFKKSVWLSIIYRTRGLSYAEEWGTWSLGNMVTLEFVEPLPAKFKIHLTAHAFGPNIGKEFEAHVGDSSIRFKLSGLPEERVLEFRNPKGLKILKINIPSPVSPKELGISRDDRSLGIAFRSMRIESQ